MSDCYVYGLFRPDTGIIFYVGMGRGNRAWQHANYRKRGKSHKDNVICKMLDDLGYAEIPIVFFSDGLSRQQAIDLEIALIYAIGRHPNGPLTNIVKGGEGLADPTPEFREQHGKRMREVLQDPDIRTVMSAKAKSRDRTGEWETYRRSRMSDPDVVVKLSEAKKGKPSAKKGKKFGPSERGKVAQSALHWITNGIEDTRMLKTESIPEGWYRGRSFGTLSQEELAKRANDIQANRETWLERNRSMIWITNGNTAKRVLPDEPIPEGWQLGRKVKPFRRAIL